jgi:hypothetical protein
VYIYARAQLLVKRTIMAAILSLAQNTDLILLSNGRLFVAPGAAAGTVLAASAGCNSCSLLETTQVALNVTTAEVLSIFSGSDISLPDRMRRAVFEPLDAVRAAQFETVADAPV